MNKPSKNIIWTIIMAPFFISLFFTQYFFMWLLLGLYVLFLGVFLTIFSIRNDYQRIDGTFKRRLFRTLNIFIGIGMIMFFSFFWATSFLDIGNYMDKNYKKIKGVSSNHVAARSLFETFIIENIKLKSVYIIPEEDYDKVIEAEYLPHSKYVINLWVYN